MSAVNPYRSPESISRDEGKYVLASRPGARATLLAQGLLYRRLVIDAPIQATLEFNGRSLHDTVVVDKHVVARQTSWWRITPRLAFVLPTVRGSIPGLVEVRVGPWLNLRGFRVTIAGQIVYAEGSFAAA